MLKLDVIIAMIDKVKLQKENYIEVMRGVKLFVDSKGTQKKGYKILSKVIEKFELSGLSELVQIK
jgi:predicted peroxiredoxin